MILVCDAVGTLIHPDPPVAVAYQQAAADWGVDLPQEEVRRRFQSVFAREHPDQCGCGSDRPCADCSEQGERLRWRSIVGKVFPEAAPEISEPLFQQLWRHFADPRHWRVFPDVARMTELVRRRGWTWVIASNFDDRLIRIRQGHAELHSAANVFHSASIGAAKPCDRFYTRVEATLQASPDRLLMVGDDPVKDVQAPRRRGWRALHVDRARLSLDQLLEQSL